MARPIWKGSISFGLVNVQVKAFTAVRDHNVHFHQLDKKSGARIRNRKMSEKSGKEVDAADIELGFEIRKGRWVTFDKAELDELRPASTRSIEVTDFVGLAEIDPIYYERTYWLAPDGDQAKGAYQLLLAAMEDRQRVAIGTVVMRNTQYLAAVRPLDGVLAMSTMRFADEVVPRRDVDGLPSRRTKPDTKAMKMATMLVDSLEADWDPDAIPRHVHRGAPRSDRRQGLRQDDRQRRGRGPEGRGAGPDGRVGAERRGHTGEEAIGQVVTGRQEPQERVGIDAASAIRRSGAHSLVGANACPRGDDGIPARWWHRRIWMEKKSMVSSSRVRRVRARL